MVKIYKQPFAHDGDAIAIPDASQPDGKMSSTDGWTPDYQLPKTDPNYKPVGRQEMNGVFKEVTEALGQVQVQGSATWSADGAPYPINAQVYHNGKQWLALRANSVEPAEGEDWTELGGKQLAADYGYTQSLAESGWQRLPSGLIIQWGAMAITPTEKNPTGEFYVIEVMWTFPVAFSVGPFYVAGTPGHDSALVGLEFGLIVDRENFSKTNVLVTGVNSVQNSTITYSLFTIGV